MKVLVNVFHPDLKRSTVNRRWVEQLRKDRSITVNVQYEQYPDWQINVERERKLILDHDRIVFQHPFYWYSTPPLMKKWLDDVLTYAWAYGPGGTALKGKEWVSAVSSGGPADAYQAGGYNNYSMSELLKPLQQTANLTGMIFLPAFLLQGTVTASAKDIEASALRYVAHIRNPELNPQVRLQKLLGEMESKGVALEA
jgi:glutathione-regulated potassium-efflux system ancillary protein KefG